MSAKKKKTRPRKQPGATGSPPAKPAGKVKRRRKGKGLSPLEAELRKTLAEMGLARARRVFARVESSFDD